MILPGQRFLTCALALGLTASAVNAASPPQQILLDGARTIGLVIDGLAPALYQEADDRECPNGFQIGDLEMFQKAFPTKAAQDEWIRKTGFYFNRGPNGENGWMFPDRVKEPEPYKELKSKIGLGKNLDGDTEGKQTANTCPHENFVDPNGVRGIDNQMYRVLGCQAAWRKGGLLVSWIKERLMTDNVHSRILIEVSDVDDRLNDPDVKVSIYKGRDSLVVESATGKPVAWQTQTIDERSTDFMMHLKGSIENGVLRTQTANIRMPWLRVGTYSDFRINGQIELKLDGNRAAGIITGYHDIQTWWKDYRKAGLGAASIAVQSGPGIYQAAKRYADGDRDPVTGECRAISAAYVIEATSVFVKHGADPAKPDAQLLSSASTEGKAK